MSNPRDPVVYADVASITTMLKEQGLADFVAGRRVIISGGAGFLGSWLVDVLYTLGAEHITIVDNLATGRIDNISHLLGTGRVELIKLPVEKLEPLKEYDFVIHMAARPSPEDYAAHPVETLLASSRGTEVMLETARLSDAVFLLTSTSEVYGDAEVVPTPEIYWGKVNPIGPRSCYDEGKRYAEALTVAYARQYGVDVRIARIFNTYGPRLDPGARYARVVPRFIMQALRNEPITIFGDGKQTRSFCYVSDMTIGLLKLLLCGKCRGEVVNLGNDEEVTILELANLIKEIVGSRSEIVFLPPREDDPRRRRPDISKARRLLNWQPTTPLRIGLQKTVEWFRRHAGGGAHVG